MTEPNVNEFSERARRISEILVRRGLYSGNSTDVNQVRQELCRRALARLERFLDSNPEASSEFWHKLKRCLELSQQEGGGGGQDDEGDDDTDIPSEPTTIEIDLIELESVIKKLPREMRDALRDWVCYRGTAKSLIIRGTSAEELEAALEFLLKTLGLLKEP